MGKALLSCWALFLSVGVMLAGNGLLWTTIGVQAPAAGFSDLAISLIMACYYVGQLCGSLLMPRLVARVGHIRACAVTSGLATAAPLIHALSIDPVTWAAMRWLTGLSFAGLYVIAESWLNDRATNATRGALLAVYMIAQLVGFASGQAGGAPFPTDALTPFLLVGVMLAIATVPVLLTAAPAPEFRTARPVRLGGLFRIVPLAVVGIPGIGMAHGAFYGLGTTWADAAGLGSAGAATFMALASVGGIVLQFPLGALSDRLDRRLMLALVTGAAALAAIVTGVAVLSGSGYAFAAVLVLGGLTGAVYPLLVAHANDRVTPEERVGLGGTTVLLYGSGAATGPLFVYAGQGMLHLLAFPITVAALHALVGGYAAWRLARNRGPERRDRFVAIAPGAPPVPEPAART
jgi:MFS family permease